MVKEKKVKKSRSIILNSSSLDKSEITMINPNFPFRNITIFYEIANEYLIEEFTKAQKDKKDLKIFHDRLERILKRLIKDGKVTENFYRGK